VRFQRLPGAATRGELLYAVSEASFRTVLSVRTRTPSSVLARDLELFMTETGVVVSISGYCPKTAWTPASLPVDPSEPGRLVLMDETIPPGVSLRVRGSQSWSIFFDNAAATVMLGEWGVASECVAFAPGAEAALQDEKLVGLRLRPRFVHTL
jgi:hypothetical protein